MEHPGPRRAAPRFLITIDTEGDNLWVRPREVATENARFLPRFQTLCERHGLRPTYLVNYEMATSPAFVELGRDVLRRGAGELGMHLHAWNSPPLSPLTADDARHMPYLMEYPTPVLRDKVAYMTDLLEDTFSVPMRSHRAGRWSMNAAYARALLERGYRVDCSVTPHVSWRRTLGDPSKEGGTDYTRCPARAYFTSPGDVRRPGASPLLEVPVTIRCGALRRLLPRRLREAPLAERALSRLSPMDWLRPNGRNGGRLRGLLDWALARRADYVEFMLHSSELMPGGSPTFPDAAHIERLYDDLEALFGAARGRFTGATLSEYYDHFRARGADTAGSARPSPSRAEGAQRPPARPFDEIRT